MLFVLENSTNGFLSDTYEISLNIRVRRVLIDRLAARVCYTDLNNYSNQMHRNKKIICPYLLVKAVSFVVVFTCPPVSDILVVM